ncbi:fasciclin-2-like isoform X3 [Artemia franciscana]|uniref:fasciclin-2-like isoform X3 n=1 Tax=Artemia franciscana TaxID=6661 RepID=UPI0032DB9113
MIFVTLRWIVSMALTLAEEPRLVITPAQPEYTAAVGNPLAFTCKAEVPDPTLITDLKWISPEGLEIGVGDSDGGLIYERIFTEDATEDDGDNGDTPRRQLFFSSVQESDSGNYTCRATYTSSQTLSASVKLSTRVPIKWIDVPAEQHATLGEEYKVRCIVNANPAPQVRWLKDGVAISKRWRHSHQSRVKETFESKYLPQSDGILIRNVSREDAGIFTCRASVELTGDLSEKKIILKIIVPPKFKNVIEDIEAIEDMSARLDCEAEGEPTPTYEFIDANGEPIIGRPGFVINPNTGILVIEEVKRENAGEYKCRASNDGGTIEAVSRLRVITKPTIVSFINATGVQNKDITIECIARGDPLPEIVFLKEGSDNTYKIGVNTLDPRVSVEASIGGSGIGGEPDSAVARLSISGATRSDDGLYKCYAENSGGIAERMGHITVEFRPNFDDTPMKEMWTWSQRPVNLTCRASSIPNATINWWNSRYNALIDENDPRYRIYNKDGESTLLVTPEDDSFYGEYRCLAENKHGKAEHLITLKQAHVPQPPTQATFQTVTATTITFKIFGPQNTGGRELTSYAVQYRKQNEEWTDENPSKEWPIESPYILENLEPQTAYVFRFFARNPVGFSTYGAQTQYMMPKRAAPEKPKILATPTGGIVHSAYSQKYDLAWRIMPDNGLPIDNFQIVYFPARNSTVGSYWTEAGPSIRKEVGPGVVSFEIKNLKPDTFYKVEIRAHNAIGFSEPTDIIVKTAKDPSRKTTKSSAISTTSATTVGTIGSIEATEQQSMDYLSGSNIVALAVVVAVLIIFIIVDTTCCLTKRVGAIAWIYTRTCGKSNHEKISEENNGTDKSPLQNELEERETAPMINGNNEKKAPVSNSVESFPDMKKSASKTSVAKDSIV